MESLKKKQLTPKTASIVFIYNPLTIYFHLTLNQVNFFLILSCINKNKKNYKLRKARAICKIFNGKLYTDVTGEYPIMFLAL